MKLLFKKLTASAVTPTKAHPSDAGWDLYADTVEYEGKLIQIRTGVAVAIPPGYVGLLFERSSTYKRGLQLANSVGVIDSGYHGEIKAVFRSNGLNLVDTGTKLLQLVLLLTPDTELEEVEELPASERGSNGFGSSGK